jgi:cell migration-inducing and hyaluronan-binding protein
MHFGEITHGVDERGEVGLLTRNIRIQARMTRSAPISAGTSWRWPGRRCISRASNCRAWGRTCTWPAIPIHWHIGGEGQGQYVENSSIHDTYSRCVTVHGTNNVRVENNVTFNTVGHCFFLEDAVETGNQFVHNLGILTKCHPDGSPCVPTNLGPFMVEGGKNFILAGQDATDILIPSDNNVSTFWITNPDNVYRDNVAAGFRADRLLVRLAAASDGRLPRPGGQREHLAAPHRLARVQGQHRHSNFDGFMSDRGPGPMAISPPAGISPRPIPPTRTARSWRRSSRISPPTRTATAACGCAARWTCSGT